MSAPQVPPRPSRAHQQHPSIGAIDVPKVPPRPNRRTSERSQSPPNRDHFPRSPFNEPYLGMTPLTKKPSRTLADSRNTSEVNLPKRPSSVNLPSVGQEGNEYADIDQFNEETAVEEAEDAGEAESKDANDPKEKRNVAGDLPLHAPKPSFTKDNAKQRVQAVTRTDSGQAAAHGIGKAPTPSASTDPDRTSKRQVSFRPPSSASTERPSSVTQYEEEHGIPEIGQRVPMHPDAGDVQAPSTSPFPQSPIGIGFHNSGYSKPNKHHRRTPSGREVLPPGSYGLHGHGFQSADQFEQQWYAKHPEALEREEGEYGPSLAGNRADWALSSDELNKLVRATSRPLRPDAGPRDEQSGYEASEGHASTPKGRPSSSQPTIKSPLRKSSFPVDVDAHVGFRKISSHETAKGSIDDAVDSETEDDEPLSLHKPKSRTNGYEEGEDSGYGVPILASDEVARTPGAEFLQPAISPAQSRRGSAYYNAQDFEQHGASLYKPTSRGGSAANSRPTSRPGSIYKISMHDEDRDMHTPLEDVDEYEPLFPEEEGNKKHINAAQRLKLRERMKRFPSQDIWEDTPNSLQLQATVDTPEPSPALPEESKTKPSAVFETAEQEARRKGEVSEEEKAKLLPKEERLAKSQFKPHIQDEIARPGMRQRFPSQDIWEDSPDSAELTTTVGDGQSTEIKSPIDEGLEAGAVVHTSGAPNKGVIAGAQSRDLATEGAPAMEKPPVPSRPNRSKISPPAADSNQQPQIPARPPRRLHQVPPADAKVPLPPSKLAESSSPTDLQESSPTEGKKAPALPDRTKPQVPARPSKPAPEANEPTTLSKVTSASSVGSEGSEKGLKSPPDASKPKPTVPARPAGSKIAALQGGFLADLNSRLKLGPQASKPQEKEPEPEVEKAPLADARKGRAKGPTKRKPAAATGDAMSDTKSAPAKWSISSPVTAWQTDVEGQVTLVNAAIGVEQQDQIKAPVDASFQNNEAPADRKLASPETPNTTIIDLPTPGLEAERNPLSAAANTPNAASPSQSQTLPAPVESAQDEDPASVDDGIVSENAPLKDKDVSSSAVLQAEP